MRLFLVLTLVFLNSIVWSQIYSTKKDYDGNVLRLDLKNKYYWGKSSLGIFYGYLDSLSSNLYLMKTKYNLDSLPISVVIGNECTDCETKIIVNYMHDSDDMIKYFKESSKLVINDTVFLSLKNDTLYYSGEIHKLFLKHNTTNNFASADLFFDKIYDSININFFVRFNYFRYRMPEYKINIKRKKVILTWTEGEFSLKKLNQREMKRILKRNSGTAFNNLDWVLRFNFDKEQLNPE